MSQKHWNRWLPSNSDEFRANSDWREQVLQSIGLGRSDFGSHDFSGEQQDEQEQHEVLPEMLLPEPAEPLEAPQISQVPQVLPSPLPELVMPLPSPMLEVPPTPTPAQDSPQMKPWSSPSATPASPMWQSLSEAVLPTKSVERCWRLEWWNGHQVMLHRFRNALGHLPNSHFDNLKLAELKECNLDNYV